jgi:translocation protein SEC62
MSSGAAGRRDEDDEQEEEGIVLQKEEFEERLNKLKTPEGLETLANFLRSDKIIIKQREGSYESRRVDYCKGNYFINTLVDADNRLEKKWPRTIPRIQNRDLALEVAKEFYKTGLYFKRAEKDKCCSTKELTALSKHKDDKPGVKEPVFDKKNYYVWQYEGRGFKWSKLGIYGIIFAVVSFTLLPLWPLILRKAIWWLSVTLLILMVGFISIRLVLFLFFWIFGIEFWILPDFFDDSLGFQRQISTLYSFEHQKGNSKYVRIILLCIFGYVTYWAITEPEGVKEVIDATIKLKDDLYEGNVFNNSNAIVMNDPKFGKKKAPTVADLLKESENLQEENREFDSNSDEIERGDSDIEGKQAKAEPPVVVEPIIEDENILGDDLLDELDKEL